MAAVLLPTRGALLLCWKLILFFLFCPPPLLPLVYAAFPPTHPGRLLAAAVTLVGTPGVTNVTMDAARNVLAQLLSEYLGYQVNSSRILVSSIGAVNSAPPPPPPAADGPGGSLGHRRLAQQQQVQPLPQPPSPTSPPQPKRVPSGGATTSLAISVAGFGADEPALRAALAALLRITAGGSALEDALAESVMAAEGVNVTLRPAQAAPTVAVVATLSVRVSTAAQATAAALDVSSLVGVGAPAEALTGVKGAVVDSPKTSVVVVLPPPLPPPRRPPTPPPAASPGGGGAPPPPTPPLPPPPPPPLASSASVTVEVPFSPASTISALAVQRALSAIASTPVPQSPGHTQPTARVADIVVQSQLAVTISAAGGGWPPSDAAAARQAAEAVAAAVAETLFLDLSQVEVTIGAAVADGGGGGSDNAAKGGSNAAVAVGVLVRGIGGDAAAAAAVARGVPAMSEIIARALLERTGIAGARVQPAAAPGGGGSTATLVVAVAVGVIDAAAERAASSALAGAFSLPALRQALSAAGIPGASGAVVSSVAVTPSPSPPPPPPPLSPPPSSPEISFPQGMVSPANRFALIVSIADDLANSLMDSLRPGETAAFSSPTLQVAARVELAPSAALTSQVFTAPESPAIFDPLPAEALTEAAAGSVIRAHLISASFDFHANDGGDAEAGVARFVLAGGNAGERRVFNVSGLASPVTFSLAAPPPGAQDRAVCAFW